MRIGYLIPEYPSQTHAFFVREMNAMKAFGHEILVISTKKPPEEGCTHDFSCEARKSTYYVYPPRARSFITFLLNPLKLCRSIKYLYRLNETSFIERLKLSALCICAESMRWYCKKHSIEHIHAHSCANAAHLAAICYLLGGPRYSLTLHGDPPVYGLDHKCKAENAKFVSVVARPLQRSYQMVSGLPREKLPIITMGVDTEKFCPKDYFRGNSQIFTLTTVARLHPVKGHALVLEAISRLKKENISVRYQIVGEGPYRKDLEKKIKELGLEDCVNLLGTQGEGAIIDTLRSSDGFILPSFGVGEASPVSVMEAMSIGVPVIATIIGGVPDMIENGHDGFLIPQKDIASIVEKLKLLISDPELRRRLGKQARERALREFDFRNKAKALERSVIELELLHGDKEKPPLGD